MIELDQIKYKLGKATARGWQVVLCVVVAWDELKHYYPESSQKSSQKTF